MQKWKWSKPVLGVLVSAGGLWAIVERIIGVPAYISDVSTWIGWSMSIGNTALLAGFGLLAGGSLFATSDWWWPRLRHRFSTTPVVSETDTTSYEAEALKALVPIIERLRRYYQPSPGNLRLLMLPIQTRTDRLDLTATLDALGVPHPHNDAGSRQWYQYLTWLKVVSNGGDIARARQGYPG